MFDTLFYYKTHVTNGVITKISCQYEDQIFEHIIGKGVIPSKTRTDYTLYYYDAILYWLRATNFEPSYNNYLSSHVKQVFFDSDTSLNLALLQFNSSLFYWFWTILSNCRDLSFSVLTMMKAVKFFNSTLVNQLMHSFYENSIVKIRNQKRTGEVKYREFAPSKSKPIIDEIDKVLAKHYGFTEEELDFIINYDIKYRMGDDLDCNDEE